MTTHPDPSRFAAEAFAQWAAGQPSGCFELIGGQVVAMAPERVSHLLA